MRIYLAGPLFTMAEYRFNTELCQELEGQGYEVFLPQRDVKADSTPKEIFEADRHGVADADVVVAIMDGPDADSGTCWECGFAYAVGIPVVLVRTDARACGDDGAGNVMLTQSAKVVVKFPIWERGILALAASIDLALEDL